MHQCERGSFTAVGFNELELLSPLQHMGQASSKSQEINLRGCVIIKAALKRKKHFYEFLYAFLLNIR